MPWPAEHAKRTHRITPHARTAADDDGYDHPDDTARDLPPSPRAADTTATSRLLSLLGGLQLNDFFASKLPGAAGLGAARRKAARARSRAYSTLDGPIADRFPSVTVCFSDFEGFTEWSSTVSPETVFVVLEQYFRLFDALARKLVRLSRAAPAPAACVRAGGRAGGARLRGLRWELPADQASLTPLRALLFRFI